MRILEISRAGLFKALAPNTTDWIRWGSALVASDPGCPEPFAISSLLRALANIRAGEYDLVILPAIHPDHKYADTWQKLAAKNALEAASRRVLSSRLLGVLMGPSRQVILDLRDEIHLCETTLRLFPGATHYFKRELDRNRSAIPGMRAKLRPLSLFLPDERAVPSPCDKDTDVFFAGAVCNDTRDHAVRTARALCDRGVRVSISPGHLPYSVFMEALARSWLVLSPEGYGWDCYRHYEACLAGSVPVINRPSFPRSLYLEDGVHCIYYDPGIGALGDRLVEALRDKARLRAMADAGRKHVLENHTRSAVARYILAEVASGGEPADLL
jgi:hypothetical protein